MQTTDLEIWNQIRAGKSKALKLLYERYYSALCAFAFKSFPERPVVEELVDNCFVRLWEQRKTIQIQHSVKSYLYFMVRNQLIDFVRSNKSNLLSYQSDLPENIPGEDEIDEQEFYATLYRAINKLPEQRRKVLELAAFESLSYKEIAQRLDISINTVKTQMGRSYQFLKEELGTSKFSILLSLYRAV